MRNNKSTANDDLNKTKEELNIRIDEIEKTNMDWCDQHLQKHNEQKAKLNLDLGTMEEKLISLVHKEIEQLQTFVKAEVGSVNKNNDGIYEKYDEKLKKIKDVCAQYFSKYEKHLLNH